MSFPRYEQEPDLAGSFMCIAILRYEEGVWCQHRMQPRCSLVRLELLSIQTLPKCAHDLHTPKSLDALESLPLMAATNKIPEPKKMQRLMSAIITL